MIELDFSSPYSTDDLVCLQPTVVVFVAVRVREHIYRYGKNTCHQVISPVLTCETFLSSSFLDFYFPPAVSLERELILSAVASSKMTPFSSHCSQKDEGYKNTIFLHTKWRLEA